MMRRGWWRSPLRAVAVCAVLGCGLLAYAHLGARYGYIGTPLKVRLAPRLQLTDDRGKPFDLSALRGRAALVYFGYTHCPDICPTTLAALAPVFQALGPDRGNAVIVFVTLDPERDTPALLHAYVSAFEPMPIGLTGPAAAIGAAAKDWGVSWRPAEGGAYIDHASVITLVDPQGRWRVRYGLSQVADPAAVARDIRHVMKS
ncbi:SCO family protein [Lichenicoccus roseus]|uniref:SCO family protein n=1 Tax=Lichenicoccus roseus TaxID=2683649 RepID=A0A5R9J055_9PROT|nr:SCO family protein [Lichenicoccus roseus]TLU71064.1 SCO family protein [Lichenicoccus roseus]